MDCSPPGSSVPGISQARMLEWGAISFSGGSSWPRGQAQVSCITSIGRRILYYWPPGKLLLTFLVFWNAVFLESSSVFLWLPTCRMWPFNEGFWGFPTGLVVKNLPANAGDVGSVPGLGRFQTKPVGHSSWAHVSEPEGYNSWACVVWSPGSRDATAMRSPHRTTREQSLLVTARESPHAATKRQHSQQEINK